MKRIAIAFAWAMALSLMAGFCLSGIFYWLAWPWWVWPLSTASYTIWFSWRDAHDLLARRLGRRERGYGIHHDGRYIPINTMASQVFESVLPGLARKKSGMVLVDESYTLVSPNAEVQQGVANEFIRYCQIRQERGKSAFSRHYWTEMRRPPLRREEYDCLMHNLVDFGFISGRRQGRSGTLNAHSEKVIRKLCLHLK